MTENNTDARFSPSEHIGSYVEIYASAFKSIKTKYGQRNAAVADVYVGEAGDPVEYINQLVFSTILVADLKADDDNVLKGYLVEVPTASGNNAIAVRASL